MFTGIIEELGKVEKISKRKEILNIGIKAKKIISNTKIGESVAVNGVCLTVVEKKEGLLFFDCIKETQKFTNLGNLRLNELVNLERPLKMDSLLSGHIVLGHVDGMGRILKKDKEGEEVNLYMEVDREIASYLISNGSIALDGVSLTILDIGENYLSVRLIPYTLRTTTLGFKKPGDYLNIEVDILAKYIKKFLNIKEKKEITEDFLKEHGFL